MTNAPQNGELDRLIAKHRTALDEEIAASGALRRVRHGVLMRASVDPLAGLHWRRVAAVVLVAGMLGGAVDLILPDNAADSFNVATVDALYDLESGTR